LNHLFLIYFILPTGIAMSETTNTSYDAFPYTRHAYQQTHPNTMATKAAIFGLRAPDLRNSRILEIGCALGGNLIPLAVSMPGCHFVGIDYASSQIKEGQKVVDELGLKNIELKTMSVADVKDTLGKFDYIICHGVFSWVPPEIQDNIFDVIRRALNPNGVAYISYNVYPGWRLRGLVRDLMCHVAKEFTDPVAKVRQARAYLNFLVKFTPRKESVYQRLLKEEAESLQKMPDSYILHEHLEEVNAPMYFHEFMSRAGKFGLQFVSDASSEPLTANLAPEVTNELQKIIRTRIDYEQQLDILTNCMFRSTLLCHSSVKLEQHPLPEALRDMTVAARVAPEKVLTPADIKSDENATFARSEHIKVSTRMPILKAALLELSQARPRALSLDEVMNGSYKRIEQSPAPDAIAKDKEAMLAFMLRCHLSGILDLYLYDPQYTLIPGDRPLASPIVRWQVRNKERVSNLRQFNVEISDLDRLVLPLCDGQHTREDIRKVIEDKIRTGAVTVKLNGEAPPATADLTDISNQILNQALAIEAAQMMIIQ
jgi:methyltransferase-like protein/cyclopropane fatty-acyl-phospholipid synthase-like methyltransferase